MTVEIEVEINFLRVEDSDIATQFAFLSGGS